MKLVIFGGLQKKELVSHHNKSPKGYKESTSNSFSHHSKSPKDFIMNNLQIEVISIDSFDLEQYDFNDLSNLSPRKIHEIWIAAA
jgi:hypothetical protein